MKSPDPRLAYGGLPVMIWTAGLDRQCDYVNERWLQFTGRRLEDELGWGWAERIHPDDREATLSAYHAAFEDRRPFDLEYRLLRTDGQYRWMLDTGAPRLNEKGRFQGYVGCGMDVTERRLLEQRQQRSERTDAIGQLAGGVAHDFNNLLTGILGHVSLLLEDSTLSPDARDDLLQIQRSADRAAGLTRQLLAFSRRQILSPRVLDLNRVVGGAISALRGVVGSRIEVSAALQPGLDPVLADPGQLEQVLLQLGSNARDAMPDGGRLELRTGQVTVGAAEAGRRPGLAPGQYITLAVRDTGRGMEPSEVERAFDPFFTSKPPSAGAGLGLPAVYGIVKQSGGYIAIDSAPGRGSTFTVYLRRVEGQAVAEQPAPISFAGSGTVLLVEDEDQIRELGRRVLERAGYTVLSARDAEAAVAIADRHPGHIHLLVTDMVLPRVGGRELAARLGIHRPAIKVLYISGTSDDAASRHRLLEPGTEFLEKPFPLDILLQKVRHLLGAPEPASRPA
jgi:PAS domain S-box-containing protein